jgi:hypothetical protein
MRGPAKEWVRCYLTSGTNEIYGRRQSPRRQPVDTRFATNARSGFCRAAARFSVSAPVVLDDVKQKQNDHNNDDRDDAAAYVHGCLLFVPPGSCGDHNNCSNSRCWSSGAFDNSTSASESRTLNTRDQERCSAHSARRCR